MNKHVRIPANAPQRWRHMVEAAIFETNTANLGQRIQDAQDAIMDHMKKIRFRPRANPTASR